MSKYNSPWSVAQRKAIPISENDPRNGYKAIERKYLSRIGSNIKIVGIVQKNLKKLD